MFKNFHRNQEKWVFTDGSVLNYPLPTNHLCSCICFQIHCCKHKHIKKCTQEIHLKQHKIIHNYTPLFQLRTTISQKLHSLKPNAHWVSLYPNIWPIRTSMNNHVSEYLIYKIHSMKDTENKKGKWKQWTLNKKTSPNIASYIVPLNN